MSTSSPSPSRWTPEVVIGLLCLVASAILPHLDLVGVGTALALVSAWLLGPLPSPLTPPRPPGSPPDQRGHVRGALLVGLLAIGLAALGALLLASSAGCLAREVVAERSVDFDVERGPPCVVRVRADGDLVHTTRGETIRCGVTIDGEARP